MSRSRLRQRIDRVLKGIEKRVGRLLERGPFIKGAVYSLRRRCGKEGCRCQKGALHQTWVLGIPEEGRKRTRVVPKGQEETWKLLAGRYRRFRRARADLVKLSRQLLRMIDEIEQQRTIPPPKG
jgi:hypothetical protein